jgi:hypothetical protein
MNDVQQGPRPKPDNLIVHIAKCLREDISISLSARNRSDVSLRQFPIDDDHDNWDSADKLENWYYIAYSIIDDLDPKRAEDALIDLVATDKEPK